MNAEAYVTLIKDFAPLVIGVLFFGGLLFALLALRPVFTRMINGLGENARSNAMSFGLAIGYGLSASLSSMAEQATALNWLILAAMAKVINPAIVAVLAYAARNQVKPDTPPPAAPPR